MNSETLKQFHEIKHKEAEILVQKQVDEMKAAGMDDEEITAVRIIIVKLGFQIKNIKNKYRIIILKSLLQAAEHNEKSQIEFNKLTKQLQ